MKKPPVKKSHHPQRIEFTITSMDTLGQGVFRENGNIGFIAKTLPNETGSAVIKKQSKGVLFAELTSLTSVAEHRQKPDCEHFAQCSGCHYLHTDYEHELTYKQDALTQLLRKLDIQDIPIEVIAAPKRQAYRNRIQLHYRGNALGMIDANNNRIVAIPHCQIIREELQAPLKELYNTQAWKKEQKREGHVELYIKDNAVSMQWNQAYSHGGFTQVFDEMNSVLCQHVSDALKRINSTQLLDLFAGNGNLSNAFVAESNPKRLMIDVSPSQHTDFFQLDLFNDDALATFKRHYKDSTFDTLLIDPPRKGFLALAEWIKATKAKYLIYVSCNPATLARDLQSIDGLIINHISLLDLFPSTYHFETVVIAKIGKSKKPVKQK